MTPPHPYLRRHLLGHAHAGGCLDDATVPAGFLPWDESGVARTVFGVPVQAPPGARRLANCSLLEPAADDLDAPSRRASLAVLSLPQPEFGTAATGWADWPVPHTTLCNVLGYPTTLTAVRGADGTALAAFRNGGALQVWNLDIARPVFGLPAEAEVTSLFTLGADAEGGLWLALRHQNGRVGVWDLHSGTPVLVIDDPQMCAMAFCRIPGGGHGLALGTKSGLIGVLSLRELDGPPVVTLQQPGPVTALAAGPESAVDGLLASGGADGRIVVWKLADGSPEVVIEPVEPAGPERGWRRVLRRDPPPSAAVTAIALGATADEQPRLAEIRDGLVRLWDLAAGAELRQLSGEAKSIAFIADDFDAALAYGGTDGEIHVVDPADGESTCPPLAGHQPWITALAAVPGTDGDPRLVSVGADLVVRVWDMSAAGLADRPERDLADPTAMSFGLDVDDWPVLLTARRESGSLRGDRFVTVYSAADGTVRRTAGIDLLAAGVGAGNHLLAARRGEGDQIEVANLSDLRAEIVRVPRRPGMLGDVAVGATADGRILTAAAVTDDAGTFVDAYQDGGGVTTFGEPAWGHIETVAVGAPRGHGMLLALVADHTVRVFDTATRKPVLKIPAPGDRCVVALGENPDGHRILAVAGHGDARIQLWNIETGEPILTIETLGEVTEMAWGPARFGHVLAVAGPTGCFVLPWMRMIGR